MAALLAEEGGNCGTKAKQGGNSGSNAQEGGNSGTKRGAAGGKKRKKGGNSGTKQKRCRMMRRTMTRRPASGETTRMTSTPRRGCGTRRSA